MVDAVVVTGADLAVIAERQALALMDGFERLIRRNHWLGGLVELIEAAVPGLLAEIRQADRQIKSGHYVKDEDMKTWLLSWGTDRELPPPKCACGKEHDDEALCR